MLSITDRRGDANHRTCQDGYKNKTENERREHAEKLDPRALLLGMESGVATVENGMEVAKKKH